MFMRKTYRVDTSRMCDLKKHGYSELCKCYFKYINKDKGYVIRVDKKTGSLKHWSYITGKTKRAKPYINDLIEAGIVKCQ